MMITQLFRTLVLSVPLLGVASTADAGPIVITLDTSPLSGVQTLGFALTNADGSANTVSLSSFDFGGGTVVAGSEDCSLGGTYSGLGCSGDLINGVTLQDIDFTAFFTQRFDAGSALSFTLTSTNNYTGPFPDQFAMYLCDATISSCYSDDASGAMLLLNLVGGEVSPARFNVFGASAAGLDAPMVAEVHVPDHGETFPLLLMGLLIAFRARGLARSR